MSKRALAAVFALVAVVSSITYAANTSLEGVKCLIAGGKEVKAEKSAEWKEGKVYFCCDGCKGKFDSASKEDKEKMAPKANHQLVASKQYAQQACPMSVAKLTKHRNRSRWHKDRFLLQELQRRC